MQLLGRYVTDAEELQQGTSAAVTGQQETPSEAFNISKCWPATPPNAAAAGFYRAMLCIRGTSYGPVSVCLCLSVCLSQVGVLRKRLNVGSHKQHHTIAQALIF